MMVAKERALHMAANDDKDKQYAMRHSLAHIMANAIQHLWPEAKFGIGPVVENGFYYDVDIDNVKLSEASFKEIEKEMRKIIAAKEVFKQFDMSIDEAIDWATQNDQPYKLELLNDLKQHGTTVVKEIEAMALGVNPEANKKITKASFYRNGDFTDLCRGPHVHSTDEVGSFKLTRISGAYWRGKESNPQMQRIYGIAFQTNKELEDYLKMLEQAAKRDHRKLGHQLDLYVISPLVGVGLPLFTPRGTVLREELNRYSQELRKVEGYQNVWVPHIAKKQLYEVSGHWAKFGDEWFKVQSQETDDDLVMKPMNCPHHQQIYASQQRSYRDLPLKYMETTTIYRDEKAGELLGLSRVRSVTQDDSHVFCKPDQINDIMIKLVDIVKEFYRVLDLPLKVRLSFRDDSDGYLGDKKLWEKAEKTLKDIVEKSGLDYYIGIGEAAFYGPKIDFMATDSLARQLQLATPQLDFVQPERFGLKYTDEDGVEKTPVMIHFALMGSIERFLSAYIEHVAGNFPVWLAPEQVRLITVNQEESVVKFADSISQEAQKLNIRLAVDNSNQSVGKKIRQAEMMKIPYVVVTGQQEIEKNVLIPRIRQDLITNKAKDSKYSFKEFLEIVAKETNSRLNKSTL